MTTVPTSHWLAYQKPGTRARLRLFCLSYAGGTAAIYRSWPDILPPEIEVCSVQLPGRGNRLREMPFHELDALVASLAAGLQPYLTMPYAIFGHSMGALVGFELIRYLRKHDETLPILLLASAHRAPQLPDPDPPVHHLPDQELIAELGKLEGTPREVLQNAELMQLLLPTLRADFEVCETYHYRQEPPLACPISVFGGHEDREVSRAELVPWREHTTAACKLRMLPGGHFFLQSAQSLLLQAVAGDIFPPLG